MIHKLTALILSCLMLVVSATSQVGLQFCLCEKTVFMGECPCDETSEVQAVAECSCCELHDDSTPEIPVPCDDCVVTIELKFDAFVPQPASDFKISNELTMLPHQAFIKEDTYNLHNSEVMEIEVSGSPPPHLHCSSRPLYVRHSAFLI